MDWGLVYGFLIAMGLFILVWIVFVIPSERRDHERRLALVQKRIAEREQRNRDNSEPQESDAT
jgi:predicted MFS family arabinose efflux permease